MAYRVSNQDDPRYVSNRQAVGVIMPFSDSRVFVPTYSSLEAYKVNLYNFFMTALGERYFQPGLGSSLLSCLFSQAGDFKSRAQNILMEELGRFFPKLDILNIDIQENPDYNSVEINIRFRITNTMLEDNFIVDIEQ